MTQNVVQKCETTRYGVRRVSATHAVPTARRLRRNGTGPDAAHSIQARTPDAGNRTVNHRDHELLARQLRNASATPNDTVLGPAMLAVFVAGLLLGGLLFTQG